MFSNNSPFGSKSKEIKVPESAEAIFVADLFVEDYVGGAELTSEALIESSPLEIFKLHSKDVTLKLMQENQSKFWIFGNYSQIDFNLIPSFVVNMRYSILEYDYKFCQHRSPEKHFVVTKSKCDCQESQLGKLVSSFMYKAQGLYWMSEKQKEYYIDIFPFLAEANNIVLSSVFSDLTLKYISSLREKAKNIQKNGWIILGSQSWVKGFSEAENRCKKNNLKYEVVWDLPYNELLEKLSFAEGFVYLPLGKDTCPRMVIEAKLLGCKLVLNENVQHQSEEWFKGEF